MYIHVVSGRDGGQTRERGADSKDGHQASILACTTRPRRQALAGKPCRGKHWLMQHNCSVRGTITNDFTTLMPQPQLSVEIITYIHSDARDTPTAQTPSILVS